MKVAIAQINTIVGDIKGNTRKIISYINKAKSKNADLVVFPELAITGYPPKDLLLKKKFVSENRKQLKRIIKETKDITAIVGFVDYDKKTQERYNAAAVISNRKLLFVQHKIALPNYDVFDEKRYFSAGKRQQLFALKGKKIGITICEDFWIKKYLIALKELSADIIISISCSPFHVGKIGARRRLVQSRAKETKTTIVYVNLVGGQDDLVFDGRSLIADRNGNFLIKCKRFTEGIFTVNLDAPVKTSWPRSEPVEDTFEALLLGIRDYVRKNRFKKVVIGLSGGIDSSLTAALAVLALGKENVVGVSMPSIFTSKKSIADAKRLAKNLGIRQMSIPINRAMGVYEKALKPAFKGKRKDTTEENIQARIRGNILMALSNKFGWLLLSTGNKSEMAVGYCTLYGDLTGGLAVLSDVLKTTVYKLADYINKSQPKALIPMSIIKKAPTPELRPGQKDQDTLPPYSVLDKILHYYIDCMYSREQIIAKGFSKALVTKIIRMVDNSEYKRHQMPIGIKITPKAFGPGRRMPITNWWGG